jgi:hypothetical protein
MIKHEHKWGIWQLTRYIWAIDGVRGDMLRMSRKCLGCSALQHKGV